MTRPTYPVAGKVLLSRDVLGNMIVAFAPEGTHDMVFDLADQRDPFWSAWFNKLDEPRMEREAWKRNPRNPHGTFEEHDPEDARREACEEADHNA